MKHEFNGHEVNGIHGVNGKKCYYIAFDLVNKLHDFTGMPDLSGNIYCDYFFRKTHARLYLGIDELGNSQRVGQIESLRNAYRISKRLRRNKVRSI